MTKEEITRIAREVGFSDGEIENCQLMFERFSALVIANHPPQSFMTWQEGYEAGKQNEREACADIAENWNSNGFPRTGVAEQIRARGQA